MNDSSDDFNTRFAAIKVEVESHRANVKDSIFRGPGIIDLLVAFVEGAQKDPAHAPEHGLHLLQELLEATPKSQKKLTAGNISVETIQEIFDIDFDTRRFSTKPWSIAHEHYDVPELLRKYALLL
ncbi:MAG: hypothetical protein M1839_006932 [Geoglossum umbratile]|nr:MAG: hypothetical protein M1839_006932 [Geoglossum umbratile]